jgi:hypothetical protein
MLAGEVVEGKRMLVVAVVAVVEVVANAVSHMLPT